jgi:nitrogenase-associated protein
VSDVLFFEKPGCANNSRQKSWLAAAGHRVQALNLLTHPWSAEELLAFFGSRPVSEWFNRAAPRVKSREILPETLGAEAALSLLLEEPLLIRRPLLVAEGRREVGFDVAAIHAWLGLPGSVLAAHGLRDAEACIAHPP